MKILVIGSGGREHAIVKKIALSNKVSKIYCAPGNAGIASIAQCVNIKATDIEKICDFAVENHIDLTMVAPDDPLVLGMVDALEARGLRAFGPNKAAAIIEGSKVFSKDLMKKYNIPTAAYEIFDTSNKAKEYLIANNTYPIVIKAEGLAFGKGVIIAQNEEDALGAIDEIMENKAFGVSGNRVVIEEFLVGQEITVLAFTDGKTIKTMPSSQDHKRAYDDDKGLNTGGMGAFSPSRIYTQELEKECMEKIYKPTIEAMNAENREFKGVIYFGLIKTVNGIKVIEYNARFGDPETQIILPRLKTDIIDIFNACIDGNLGDIDIIWHDNACVCIVLASGGYPQKYETGYEISGLNELEGKDGIDIIHAGTKCVNDKILTAGGRVLGIVATGKNLDDAINNGYDAVKQISFTGMHYRKDIGIKR